MVVLGLTLSMSSAKGDIWADDFPKLKFPVTMVNQYAERLAPVTGHMPKIFTSDQWGDYLTYRFYPRIRIFVDGRNDLFGPTLGKEYVHVAGGHYDWEQVLDRYQIETAIVPIDWPLAELLKRNSGWRLVKDDGLAILFERRTQVLMKTDVSAERFSSTIRSLTHEQDRVGKTGDSPCPRLKRDGSPRVCRNFPGRAELELAVRGEPDRIRPAFRLSCAAAAGLERAGAFRPGPSSGGPMTARAWLIVIVGLAAVIEDLGWRRVSNWTSGGAVAAGLIVHYLQKGWSGAWHSLLGALIGFGVFLVFYLLGGMGGGDVKLMSGFGALLGRRPHSGGGSDCGCGGRADGAWDFWPFAPFSGSRESGWEWRFRRLSATAAKSGESIPMLRRLPWAPGWR